MVVVGAAWLIVSSLRLIQNHREAKKNLAGKPQNPTRL
jgi:hypothetical protein